MEFIVEVGQPKVLCIYRCEETYKALLKRQPNINLICAMIWQLEKAINFKYAWKKNSKSYCTFMKQTRNNRIFQQLHYKLTAQIENSQCHVAKSTLGMCHISVGPQIWVYQFLSFIICMRTTTQINNYKINETFVKALTKQFLGESEWVKFLNN